MSELFSDSNYISVVLRRDKHDGCSFGKVKFSGKIIFRKIIMLLEKFIAELRLGFVSLLDFK